MSTMNLSYFQQIKNTHKSVSITLDIVHKLLIVISVYLAFGLLVQYVYANDINETSSDPYQAQHGSVWLLPDNGIYLEAMQLQTDVDYDITGPIARARVKQQFKNNSAFWAEGIYVFPLPEKAAVDRFKMIIGERIIEGQIKERVTAKRIYEKAKAAGKKTSLIEQQRPNVFTTSLANIAPGETISIEFEYQQLLEYRDNSYRLRYPMVVGPRYHPSSRAEKNQPESIAAAMKPLVGSNETSVVSETDRLKSTNNPTRIHIMLDAGVNLVALNSSYHKIHINQTSETRYSIATVGENIIANRDFELVWQPELHNEPQLSVFTEIPSGTENDHYTMLTLLPPELTYLEQKVQAREVIFVLDISGSMAGTSIQQAKAALATALDKLTSIDRFNVIWFNNNSDKLFPTAVEASSHNRDYAKQFIKQLQAGGGTEMLAALKMALSKQPAFSRFRQVVFLTDGNISNEAELFNVIKNQLANSRLFTIGIGSAPNAYFMSKAANQGRGTFTYIGDINEVNKKTAALFKKLETPALINIQLSIDNDTSEYEIFPKIIPDLYAGEPLTLLLKGEQIPESITVKGDYGNSEWQTSSPLTATSHSGIRITWAREKIAWLMNLQHESSTEEKRNTIKTQIINTALQHHLVSRFTSLVAVDVTPANAEGLLYHERLKNNLPHGWKNATSDNGLLLAQTATRSQLNLLLAVILFFMGVFIYQLKNSYL